MGFAAVRTSNSNADGFFDFPVVLFVVEFYDGSAAGC